MTGLPFWSSLAVLGPLLGALIALEGRRRAIHVGLVLGAGSSLAAATGLVREVTVHGPAAHRLGGWGAPLGIELLADGFGVTMLAVTAVVGAAVSVYASAYFGEVIEARLHGSTTARGARFFAPLWLLAWTGLNSVYLSADLFNLYVGLEIVGLSSAALVTLAVTPKATAAGMRYLLVSLTGSLLFLLGVSLLYVEYGVLSISGLAAARPSGTLASAALAVMTVGLAAKTALFPLHAWLPPAHAAAPAPASAVLSGLVVKGPFVVLVRLWLEVYGGGSTAGAQVLGVVGAAAILWGSVLALRQESLKRLIGYSTVAQLGYLFVMFPLLAGVAGQGSADAWAGGTYHALSHALAKAAMFLAAGTMTYAVASDSIRSIAGIAQRLPLSFFAFGLGGLSLAGLPPSGGFVAKWLLLRAAVETGRWPWAVVIAAGGLLAVAYVLYALRFAFEAAETSGEFRPVPRRMEWAAMALALASVALGLRAVEALNLLLASGAGPAG